MILEISYQNYSFGMGWDFNKVKINEKVYRKSYKFVRDLDILYDMFYKKVRKILVPAIFLEIPRPCRSLSSVVLLSYSFLILFSCTFLILFSCTFNSYFSTPTSIPDDFRCCKLFDSDHFANVFTNYCTKIYLELSGYYGIYWNFAITELNSYLA